MLNASLQHLELFGKGYVIEHCIAFFRRQQKEQMYRVYITDALKAIAENTSRMYGGVSIKTRYADIIGDENTHREEKRTPDQIIDHIRNKLKAL